MKKKITIEAHLLQPGMTLADRRYRIDSLLGNNGIMVTYKGYDTLISWKETGCMTIIWTARSFPMKLCLNP